MQYLNSPYLERQHLQSGFLKDQDKPALFLDGEYYAPKELPIKLKGDAAYVVGAKQPYLAVLAETLEAEYLYFYELRCHDLTPISRIRGVRHLRITWATKFTDLDWVRSMGDLQTLRLEHTTKVRSLDPLADLSDLRAFEFSGGMDTDNTADSLAPLAKLPLLREVRLTALKVLEGGLRPLAECKSLEELDVHYRFETSDYAYLSVAKPNLICNKLQPWVDMGNFTSGDRLIVGKGKPFLNSKKDQARIEKYEREFLTLQTTFRQELGL